jgi:hypothetical protein
VVLLNFFSQGFEVATENNRKQVLTEMEFESVKVVAHVCPSRKRKY